MEDTMTNKKKLTELADKDLDDVSGGKALQLPAVQAVIATAPTALAAGLEQKTSPDQVRARTTKIK